MSKDADWRAFRARLVAASSSSGTSISPSTPQSCWAHELKTPEPGCLLLANPLYFTTHQTYFQQAVILIIAHDTQGTIGVIINKPTQHKMGEFKDKTNIGNEFDDCILYLGGDVGDPNTLTVVHGAPNKEDSQELISGVFLSNGMEGVSSALAHGEITSDHVKIVTRYAGWGPGQLVSEVNRGVWMMAAASKDVIISPIPWLSPESNDVVDFSSNGSNTGTPVGRGTASASTISTMNHTRDNAEDARGVIRYQGEELWHYVLNLMGGDFAALSAAVRGEYRADIMGLPKGGDGGEGGNGLIKRKDTGPGGEHQNHGSGI